MRKWVLIFTLLFASKLILAQTFTVGSTCCNYHLVNKTYTLNPWCNCCPGTSFSYSLDIDGDLQKDLEIGAYQGIPCFSGGTNSSNVYAKSFSGAEIVYTTLPTGCPMTSIVQKLNYGSPINAALNWSATPTSTTVFSPGPYLYFYSYTPQASWTCGQTTVNHYLGFRKILPSNDTIYGWVNVDSNAPIKIVDYAYTCGSYTGTPVPSTITTSSSVLQKCDSVLLSATPSGGIFYGQGVSGNYFSTKSLVAGIYTVNYAIPNLTGCATLPSSVVFTVNSAAAITNTQTSICVGESFTLTASPIGGTFSGVGVTGNVFSPATTGTFSVKYDYTINATCSQTTIVTFTVDACVGISESEKLNSSISVYPNPAASKLFVEMKNELSSEIELNLRNIDGRKIKSLRLTNKKQEIDLSEISSGIYFVEIGSEKSIIRKKLIISR
ncbi:MAG: T9SS type A sorting domain-containing protein [Bacteroidetes bacterium]|nr:T9SS type A sorting domain-containing protein [Bacteroidota bacterium]